jgi:hypothetical protein
VLSGSFPERRADIEAQHARQRMLGIEAEAIVETATAEFKRLVGMDQEAAIELVADLAGLKVGTPNVGSLAVDAGVQVARPFKAVLSQARESRPERKSLLFRISAAEERVAAHRPAACLR